MIKSDMKALAANLTQDEKIEMATICMYALVEKTNIKMVSFAPDMEINGMLVKAKLKFSYKYDNHNR